MGPLALFTWGYWGWGTSVHQLIKAVDVVEASRGYEPPMFVDIRISRSVRAPGFNGNAFEQAVGASRYRWIPDLGNVAVKDGGPMRIKNPAAAETLLNLAQECSSDRRRVLFFCSCEFPGVEGQERCCHRTVVAGLVVRAAKQRNLPVQVVEWPGGEPPQDGLQVELSSTEYADLMKRPTTIPLGSGVTLADAAGLPWGTVLLIHPHGEAVDYRIPVLSGPARFTRGQWHLPNYGALEPGMTQAAMRQESRKLRAEGGYEPRGVD